MSAIVRLWTWIRGFFVKPRMDGDWWPALREQAVEKGMEAGFLAEPPSLAWDGLRGELLDKLAAEGRDRADSDPATLRDDRSVLAELRADRAADVDPYKVVRESWADALAVFRDLAANADAETLSRPLAICAGAAGVMVAMYRRSDLREAALTAAFVILLIYGAPALLTLVRAGLPAAWGALRATVVTAVRSERWRQIRRRSRRIRSTSIVVDRDQARMHRLSAVLAADFARGYALGGEARGPDRKPKGPGSDDRPRPSDVEVVPLESNDMPSEEHHHHVN